MRKKDTSSLLVAIVLSSIFLTIMSAVCIPSKYQAYKFDIVSMPIMTPLFQGMADGVFPWSENKRTQQAKQDYELPEEITEPLVETAEQETAEIEEQIPVKTFTTVTDDYFDDALFIGDSRMAGLSQYCQAIDERATFYAKKSLTIFDIQKKAWIETEDGSKITVEQALSEKQYGKIYLMVGINELGVGNTEYFRAAYADVVNRIHLLQPDAIIYINSIMHVAKEKNDTDTLYNNTNINARNEAIATLADDQQVFYLNMNECVDDEEGNLDSTLTFDQVHLKGSAYEPWHEYLLSHAIM